MNASHASHPHGLGSNLFCIYSEAAREARPCIININMTHQRGRPCIIDINMTHQRARPCIIDINMTHQRARPCIIDINMTPFAALLATPALPEGLFLMHAKFYRMSKFWRSVLQNAKVLLTEEVMIYRKYQNRSVHLGYSYLLLYLFFVFQLTRCTLPDSPIYRLRLPCHFYLIFIEQQQFSRFFQQFLLSDFK